MEIEDAYGKPHPIREEVLSYQPINNNEGIISEELSQSSITSPHFNKALVTKVREYKDIRDQY